MKIGIYILNINDYNPEVWHICYPWIKRYADKVNAELTVITKRKFEDWHVTYEKVQVYDLGRSNNWNIVMDSDVLIHPDMPDLTKRINDYEIGARDMYGADSLFSLNSYFYRDRRKVAISGVFAMASGYCHDFWTPLPGCQDDYLDQIHPWVAEASRGITYDYFITEYWMSHNLAKYGLKYSGILHENERWLFHHSYTAINEEEKLRELNSVLKSWNL